MTNPIIAMFPGQGSQLVGMAKDFYDAHPHAQERFKEADDILNMHLSEICFSGPMEKLTETAITQPAILTASVIAFEAYRAKNSSTQIIGGCGHSLGEYSALVAAGSISFGDAVKLVHLRGSYMQDAVPIGHGKMAAVLGKTEEEIRNQIQNIQAESNEGGSHDGGSVEIANINAPGQIVLAGTASDIDSFITKSEGWKMKELQVSAPFHSALMMPAQEKLASAIQDIEITTPQFPIYQNVDAQASQDPEAIREKLIQQVTGTVRWVDCVQNLVESASEHSPTAFEFGPGKVLCGLLKRINKAVPSRMMGTLDA